MVDKVEMHTPRRVPRLLRDQFRSYCKSKGYSMSGCIRACMAYWVEEDFDADKLVAIQMLNIRTGLLHPVVWNMPRHVHRSTKLAFAKWCSDHGWTMGPVILAIMQWCVATYPELEFEMEKWGKA